MPFPKFSNARAAILWVLRKLGGVKCSRAEVIKGGT